jgi:hypothetical protein
MRGRGLGLAVAALVGAAVVLAFAPGEARAAGKLRKVHIDSRPLGATVFIDNKDDGPRGETPLDLELAPGTYTVIVELNEYDAGFAELVVPKPGKRDRKPVELVVELKRAMAQMQVEGAPPDATIRIDDLPGLVAGEYVDGFDVTAGDHHIVVELDGKTLYEDYVSVESATFKTITIGEVASGGGDGPEGDGPEGDGPEGGDEGPKGPASKRDGPLFVVGPLVEVGWRSFRYQQNDTEASNLPIDQSGEAVIGLVVETNPFRLSSVRALHPLAAVFAIAFGVPQDVSAKDSVGLGDNLTTFWRRYQAGLRYRFGLGSVVDLDVEAGYGGYIYRFSGNIDDIARLPDASYQTVRLGGRLAVRLLENKLAPFVGGENRIILSGGALEERYSRGYETQGFAFRAGFDLALWAGKLATRVEGSYSRFEWSFTAPPTDAMYIARGGTDSLFGISLTAAYSY